MVIDYEMVIIFLIASPFVFAAAWWGVPAYDSWRAGVNAKKIYGDRKK